MATSSKQYKAIGEDLWKGRTDKIVRLTSSFALLAAAPLTLSRNNRMQSCSR
jgi:hypothetical protein